MFLNSFLLTKISVILRLAIIILFFSTNLFAEIRNIEMEGRIRYFSTLVDDLGTRYDDTRPGPALDLHFNLPLTDNLSVKSFNYIINYNDTTSGDETMNTEFNQRLGLLYKRKGTVFYPYGKILWHDENPKKQVDNSHLGLVIQQYFSKDVFISADYREELSDGAVLAGVRHSQRVFDLRFHKKNLTSFADYPVHLKLGYAEGVNLRGAKSVRFDMDITKRLELSVKYVDNIGKGPISSTLNSQNQDFLVGSIGYKF